MEVQICVGSSCHMKGSYPIIRQFEQWIRLYGLDGKVTLKAAFCLGDCTCGVAIRIDGKPVTGLTVSHAETVFKEQILAPLTDPGGTIRVDR